MNDNDTFCIISHWVLSLKPILVWSFISSSSPFSKKLFFSHSVFIPLFVFIFFLVFEHLHHFQIAHHTQSLEKNFYYVQFGIFWPCLCRQIGLKSMSRDRFWLCKGLLFEGEVIGVPESFCHGEGCGASRQSCVVLCVWCEKIFTINLKVLSFKKRLSVHLGTFGNTVICSISLISWCHASFLPRLVMDWSCGVMDWLCGVMDWSCGVILCYHLVSSYVTLTWLCPMWELCINPLQGHNIHSYPSIMQELSAHGMRMYIFFAHACLSPCWL